MSADVQSSLATPGSLPTWLTLAVTAALATGSAGSLLFANGRFALGASLLLLSVLLLRWPFSIWTTRGPVDLSPWRQRAGLIAVCFVAVFFRFHRLEPPGLWGDDAINGLLALDVLEGKIRSPFTLIGHAFSSFHALTNFVIAGSFSLFGSNLYALRLPGVIANLLCVPLLYGTAAPLFGPRIALLTALFFATSPFQLGHAKGLLQNPLGQLCQIFGLCLIIQGMLRKRRWALAASGVPIGLSLCTYHSAKLVPMIAGFTLWQAWRIDRSRGSSLRLPLVASVVAFIAAAAPAIDSYAKQWQALTGRINATGLWAAIQTQGDLWPLWDSFWRTITVFHYQQGPIYHWFGIGTDPGLTAVGAGLVLHGLVQSLRHWSQPRHLILIGWLFIGLIPGIFSSEAPRGYRILIATPPLYVWMALPLARLLGIARRSGARAVLTVTAAAVLAVPIVDFNYYFYRLYTHGLFRLFQADHMLEMARALHERGPGWRGYLLADTFDADYESLRFLRRLWGLQLESVASLSELVPVREQGPKGTLLLMARGNLDAMALLRAAYPLAAPEIRHEVPARSWWLDRWWPLSEVSQAPPVAFALMPLPPVTTPAPDTLKRGLALEVTANERWLQRIDPFPYYFFFPATFSGVYNAHWRGRLRIDEPRGMTLDPESHQRLKVQIDGHPWERNQVLAAGEHDIDIAIDDATGALRLRLYWQPPDGERQLIPPSAFTPADTAILDHGRVPVTR